VKIIKDKTGHFGRGLWYEEGEIEGIAERHRQDCLRLANEPDSPALDVDKFVEIYLPRALNTEIILDPYTDLQSVVIGSGDSFVNTDLRRGENGES
jgi:hypothetical protein